MQLYVIATLSFMLIQSSDYTNVNESILSQSYMVQILYCHATYEIVITR